MHMAAYITEYYNESDYGALSVLDYFSLKDESFVYIQFQLTAVTVMVTIVYNLSSLTAMHTTAPHLFSYLKQYANYP